MINRFLILFAALWFGCCEISLSYDDALMSPVQLWRKAKLIRNIILSNSSEVYVDVANLMDQAPPAVQPQMRQMNFYKVNLAWLSDSGADQQTYSLTLAKGTSVFEAIRQVSERRKEVFVERHNYIIIAPPGQIDRGASHEEATTDTRADLNRQIDAVILTPVTLRYPQGDAMEAYINVKLKESGSISHEDKAVALVNFRMNGQAKSRVGKINIIGNWTYRELLDAICGLTGLRWRIDGNTLWLEGK